MMHRSALSPRGLGLALLALLCGAPLSAFAARLPASVLEAIGNPNRKAAISRLTEVSLKESDSTAQAWELLFLGELKRLNGDDKEARALFERVAGDFPASGAKNAAILGMAIVDAHGKAAGNTRSTLELIAEDAVPDTMNADRWLLIGQARAAEGTTPSKLNEALDRAAHFSKSDAAVDARVTSAIKALRPPAAPTPAGEADRAALEEIRSTLREGDLKGVTTLTTAFVSRFPSSPFAPEVQTAAARAAAGKPPDASRVAVLLPLTGKFAQPAASLRSAIEQASESLGGAYTVAVYDTAGVAAQCVTALQKAVIEDGATIVIGPLTKEEAATCAPAAQALHVAMLPLTSSADVLTAGDQVFRPYPTSEDQVRALVAETLGRRSMKSYAVIHPKTAYGENAAKAFVNEVTGGGGSVTVDIGYDPTTADFRSVAKQLAGKTFEAIFIPDTYQTVALVASAIAFQEISVGAFQTEKGPPAVPLLGLNAWHNDEIARRGGAYVQRGIFVDAFDARDPDPAVTQFVEGWKGTTPPSVVDAIGYDAMLLSAAALAAGGDPAEALTRVEIANSVAGTLGFSDSREARRKWHLLTVTRTGIEPLPSLVVQPSDPQ
jgi:branched-chain amino acid transport system substrate-binding protein